MIIFVKIYAHMQSVKMVQKNDDYKNGTIAI